MKKRQFVYGPIRPEDIITLEQIGNDPALRDRICPPEMRRYVLEQIAKAPNAPRSKAKGKAS